MHFKEAYYDQAMHIPCKSIVEIKAGKIRKFITSKIRNFMSVLKYL